MKVFKATQAKDHFGEMLDSSRTEPVRIEKNNKGVAVVISLEEYNRLIALEDNYLAMKAKEASKGGYLGKSKSKDLLESMLNAED